MSEHIEFEELRSEVEALRDEISALADADTLDEDGEARLDAALVEFDAKRDQLAKAEARAAKVAEVKAFAVSERAVKPVTEAFHVNTRTSSDIFDFDTLPYNRSEAVAELRGRALDAIEKHVPKEIADSAREAATSLVKRESTRHFDAAEVAEIVVRTTSPGYVKEFRDYLKNPGIGGGPEMRAAMSLTAANGGYLIPQFLDPTIVLTNAGVANDIRQVSRIEQITVDQWDGVTSAGVTAEWLAEGTEAADATPTFTGPTITPQKAAAWLFGSYEALADSGFDQVGMLIGDAFDRLEETAFTTGTGSGQPYGFITRLSGTGPVVTGASGAAGAADFVVADVYALDNALGPRWRRNANWMAAKSVYNSVRQFATANNYHAFWTDFGGGQPASLLGYPARYSEAMDTTVVSGSNDYVLVLGDFSQYCIVDRIGTSIMYEPMVKSTGNGRPTGQAGWFAFKRTGADVLTSNAFKTLKL